MHEAHHNTWNTSKRKPQRLRGTLANKYVHLISFGFVGLYALGCHLYINADWVQPHKHRLVKLFAPTELEKERKLMLMDGFMGSAIATLYERRLDAELGIKPEKK